MLLLGITELVFLLFLIEVLSWIFTLFLKKIEVLKYLIVQTIFLLRGLIRILWRIKLFLLIIILKLGVPPFHLWFINLRRSLRKYSFLFITTAHKLPPLFCITKFLYLEERHLLVIITLISGILIIESRELFSTFIFSSMVHSGWIIIRSLISLKVVLCYFLLYRSIVFLFITCLKTKSLWFARTEQNSRSSSLWLILSGFPPFSIFWLKVILIRLLVVKTIRYRVVLTVTSVLSLFVYYRIFHFIMSPSSLRKEQISIFPIFITVGII